MKLYLTLIVLASAMPTFAALTAPLVGNFEGLAFSSATSRQALQIRGGNFTSCEASGAELTKCQVQDGIVQITGTVENELRVNLATVVILHNDGTTPAWHYYYKGRAELSIAGRTLNVPVSITVNLDDKQTEHVTGFIELPEQYARTSFDAYRVK